MRELIILRGPDPAERGKIAGQLCAKYKHNAMVLSTELASLKKRLHEVLEHAYACVIINGENALRRDILVFADMGKSYGYYINVRDVNVPTHWTPAKRLAL